MIEISANFFHGLLKFTKKSRRGFVNEVKEDISLGEKDTEVKFVVEIKSQKKQNNLLYFSDIKLSFEGEPLLKR